MLLLFYLRLHAKHVQIFCWCCHVVVDRYAKNIHRFLFFFPKFFIYIFFHYWMNLWRSLKMRWCYFLFKLFYGSLLLLQLLLLLSMLMTMILLMLLLLMVEHIMTIVVFVIFIISEPQFQSDAAITLLLLLVRQALSSALVIENCWMLKQYEIQCLQEPLLHMHMFCYMEKTVLNKCFLIFYWP